PAAFLVAQGERLRRSEHVGHHAAAQTADAEARGLFCGEDYKLDRAARLESKFLENANGFETAQHANASVVEAGIGNRVDVRACTDGRECGIAAFPAG